MNKHKKKIAKQARLQKAVKASSPWSSLNMLHTILLLAYGFVTVLTPNLMTLDSLGPKFLSLAILNLISYILLLAGKEFRNSENLQMQFFRTSVGLVYTLFLVVALLSFVNAINVNESIINLAKLFTLFSAAYTVSVILRNDSRPLRILALAMSLLLVFDSFTVFYHVATSVMAGKGPNIYEIKSIYSNKNILSAALFVKMPFALWLLAFEVKRWRFLGFFTILVSLVAILLMSTRTFYLGFIFMTLAFVTFMGIRYHRRGERRQLITLFVTVGATLAIAFLLFSGALKFLYPKTQTDDPYNIDFISRMKTISQGEGQRTEGWKRTLKLMEEHPVLGVGTGNWKIEVLKYENLTSKDYIYMYKAHNDFLETASETGLVGGILFVSIFFLTGYNFLRAFFRRGATEDSYKYLFLPAFGLFAYSFDAFFNFPADRPEICSLFAIYVGAGIAFSSVRSRQYTFGRLKSIFTSHQSPVTSHQSPVTSHQSPVTSPQSPVPSHQSPAPSHLDPRPLTLEPKTPVSRLTSYLLPPLFLLFQLFSIYFLYLNFESLKLQRLIKDEQIRGPLTLPSAMFISGFPWIPDINVQGEPIAVQKARYLFEEGKYQETIDLLKTDRSSPYDTRPEVFIAVSYSKLGVLDSALVYYDKVYKQKPNFYGNIANLVVTLENMGRYEEAAGYLDPYTGDPAILNQQKTLLVKARVEQFDTLYLSAVKHYQDQDFRTAVNLFSQIIDKAPDFIEAYDLRAFCYYSLKEYRKSIDDIEKVFASGLRKPNLINMRGVNYQMLGNIDAACRDFEEAMQVGDKDGIRNYELFCAKDKK